MKISKFYSILSGVFSVCLIIGITNTALAQKQVYFYNYPDTLSKTYFKKGYILTLQGDTIKGEIRKPARLGDWISRNDQVISKITFTPDNDKKQQKDYQPGEIKGFGIVSYPSQWVIDLNSEYTQSGLIKSGSLKKIFTSPGNADPVEQFVGQLTHDGLAHFESVTDESGKTIFFYQRLAEGKLTVFYNPSTQLFYYNKPENLTKTSITPVSVVPVFEYRKTFDALFKDCEEALKIAQQNQELYQSANFLRIAGFYNMNCGKTSGKLESKPDFVILSSGDKIEGNIAFKGYSTHLESGMIDKISITNTMNKTTKLTAKQIRSFTRYINGSPVIFEHLPAIDPDEKRFLLLLSEGKTALYQNLKGVDLITQSYPEYVKKYGVNYVLKKEGKEPVAITKSNFEEYYNKLLNDSPALKSFIENNPSKKKYENLPELVRVYNGGLN